VPCRDKLRVSRCWSLFFGSEIRGRESLRAGREVVVSFGSLSSVLQSSRRESLFASLADYGHYLILNSRRAQTWVLS